MNRHERYSKRSGGEYVDENNPIPGWIDPITLEPCANPAISPYGHVMGMATWKVISRLYEYSAPHPFTPRIGVCKLNHPGGLVEARVWFVQTCNGVVWMTTM